MALTLKGTATSVTTSVTIPAHAIGDLIIIGAARNSLTGLPTIPTASGTVPTWTSITSSNTASTVIAYTVATAANHTSGSWTNAAQMFAVVISGQAASPFGGTAITTPVRKSGTATATTFTAPAVTLTKSDGTSKLFHFFWVYNGGGGSYNLGTTPTGYTEIARTAALPTATSSWILQKDSVVLDGAISRATTSAGTWNTSSYWAANSIEVLAAPIAGDTSVTATATPDAALTRTAGVSAGFTATATTSGQVGIAISASTTATATSSAGIARTANVAASSTATATFSATEVKGLLAQAGLTATATPDGFLSRGQSLSAELSAAGDTGTADERYGAKASSSLFATFTPSLSDSLRTALGQGSLTSSVTTTANLTEFGIANASATATATPAGVLVSNQKLTGSISGTATQSGSISRGQGLDTSATASGTTSSSASYGAKSSSNLMATATTSSGSVKTRYMAASLTATVTTVAGAVENEIMQATLTATSTAGAEITKKINTSAALTASATTNSSAKSFTKISAALTATFYADAMLDELREVIYVEADDRTAVVDYPSRKAFVENYINKAVVISDGTRKASVVTSSRSYQIGEDDRSISIVADDRDAPVPAQSPKV